MVIRQAGCHEVVRTVAFLIVRRLLDMVGCGPQPDAKDVEIAVLAISWCYAGRSR
jgi:hypothetical protein